MIKIGVNFNISDSEYFADEEFMTRSNFLGLLKSVNHFKVPKEEKVSKALRFGNMLDTYLTDRENFDNLYTLDFVGDKRLKAVKEAYKLWKTFNSEKIIITEKEWKNIQIMEASLMANPETAPYFTPKNGYKYQVVVAAVLEFNGKEQVKIPFKVKLDIMKEHEDYIEVIDLKTTASLDKLEASIYKWGYHLQQYLYTRVLREVFKGKPVHWTFAFVEKEHPYDSINPELTPDWMIVAHETIYNKVIPRWINSRRTDKRIFNEKMVIPLPSWLER